MVEIRQSRFISHDGTPLHLRSWQPVNPVAVILIVHGMKDHSGRYLEFAEHLAKGRISVHIPDHRGHGLSARNEDLGYFGGKGGWSNVVKDIDSLIEELRAQAPTLPFYLLGHSLGAQVARHYLMERTGNIDGLILSGAMQQPRPVMLTGIALASIAGALKGERATSRLIEWLSFGSNNRRFKPSRTSLEWISNDPARVDDYVESPYCGFDMTVSAYREFFASHLKVRKFEKRHKFPSNLPVFIYGGAMDPVIREGKQLEKIRRVYEKAGVKNLHFKLFPDGRHEVHNDLNRVEVFRAVEDWIKSRNARGGGPTSIKTEERSAEK